MHLFSFFVAFGLAATPPEGGTQKKIVTAVEVEIPELVSLQGKTVFSVGRGAKKVELSGFDLAAMLADELANGLQMKKVYAARTTGKTDGIPFAGLWDGSAKPPEQLEGDLFLLARVKQCTLWAKPFPGVKDRFFLEGEARLYNRSGKKVWSWHTGPAEEEMQRTMTGGFYVSSKVKTEQLFTADQKGAKDGVNRIVEKWCQKVATDVSAKRF